MKQGVSGATPRELDQFFTKPEVARDCIKILNEKFPITKCFDCIIEPSHGNNAFVDALNDWSEKIIAFDIDSKNETSRRDFLKVSPNEITTHRSRVLVIGNPPFGKGARKAIEFFNHASKFTDTIAFIVPRTFRKESIKNTLNLYFEMIYETLLDPKSFIFENVEYSVPCLFQIWVRVEDVRKKSESLNKTRDFQFVNSKLPFDLVVRRVGVNAGRIFDDLSKDYSPQSHNFISIFDKSKKQDVINKLKSLNLEKVEAKFNVAGNPCLNASEICNLYDK